MLTQVDGKAQGDPGEGGAERRKTGKTGETGKTRVFAYPRSYGVSPPILTKRQIPRMVEPRRMSHRNRKREGAAMRIIDISPVLRPGIPVWPGDGIFQIEFPSHWSRGDSLMISTFKMGAHTGAHLDAPAHVLRDGAGIADIDLSRCVGRARVITVFDKEVIGTEDLEAALWNSPPRLILRTRPEYSFELFSPQYSHLSIDLAALLIERRFQLVGTDGPSLDRFDNTSLPVHTLLARAGILQLENLRLTDVEDGDYELIALPLPIADAEASPVRAILRELPPEQD